LAERLLRDDENVPFKGECNRCSQPCDAGAHYNEINRGSECHPFEAVIRSDGDELLGHVRCPGFALQYETYHLRTFLQETVRPCVHAELLVRPWLEHCSRRRTHRQHLAARSPLMR